MTKNLKQEPKWHIEAIYEAFIQENREWIKQLESFAGYITARYPFERNLWEEFTHNTRKLIFRIEADTATLERRLQRNDRAQGRPNLSDWFEANR